MKLARNFCPLLRQVFTREGVRVPIPFGWISELHQIHRQTLRLRALVDQRPPVGKLRIRAKWELANATDSPLPDS